MNTYVVKCTQMCYTFFEVTLMKQKKIPIIISSQEALHRLEHSQASVLCITRSVFLKNCHEIDDIMSSYGYTAANISDGRGIFYWKSAGPDRFDPECHEIYDPLSDESSPSCRR